ncbi:family 10 glycosylhydrolase [Nostoc sp. LEGE 06077]|uniref:family 10 glycosylhydrolase n=1 Tax=Nostoc sp. LEGE 06077 TaxID=915325 RepID=UPI00188243A1|nr:family 10 glycosylhydrolase [Nostoc sp. LEGE 06077]MBE9205733.1 family 10 glycosylhydrolase [Nostoc sp. LEGE 06077]
MPHQKKERSGCGCLNIPLSVILAVVGGGYWWFSQPGNLDMISKILSKNERINIPIFNSTPKSAAISIPTASLTPNNSLPTSLNLANKNNKAPSTIKQETKTVLPPTPWEKKVIRGIYLTRYQATNNADEQTIRQRVRYYHSQGINTIIHGVWGNGCTMYKSEVMQQTLGYSSCPNQFQEKWLNWLIDEAHKQEMQVHAYFEKGIKIDKNSPIFDLAVAKKWIVPGIDKTYAGIDHYVLDVENPEVATFFKNISVEFVNKYPNVDAVQWDDYLGYYAELPGKVDRTEHLTKFVQQMTSSMKKANSSVSFDICHHNPYWAKKYFAADWEHWGVDRVFIQAYNDTNFAEELNYAQKYAGIAITDKQLGRLKELVNNPNIHSILVFPFSGNPEKTASNLKQAI